MSDLGIGRIIAAMQAGQQAALQRQAARQRAQQLLTEEEERKQRIEEGSLRLKRDKIDSQLAAREGSYLQNILGAGERAIEEAPQLPGIAEAEGPGPAVGPPAALGLPLPVTLPAVPEAGLLEQTMSPVGEVMRLRRKAGEEAAAKQAAELGTFEQKEKIKARYASPAEDLGTFEEKEKIRAKYRPRPSTPAVPGTGAGANWKLKGEAFFESLPPQDQEIIGGLIDYTLDPAKTSSMRGNQRQQVIAAAKRADPGFDMSAYPRRAALRQDFATGKTSKSLDSLNQLSGHLSQLSESFEAEQTGNIQALNAFVNAVATATGDPRVTNATTARTAVAEEVATLMRGGVGTEGATKAWQTNFSPNASPAQQRGAIGTMRHLVGSRLGSLRQRWKTTMGSVRGFDTLLTPEATTLFGGGVEPATGRAGATGGLPSPKSKAEYDALPAGSQYIDPTGQARTKR